MAPITAADQAFLQLLTQRKVLEESEALEAMDAVGSKLGGFGAFDAGGSGDARADLRATLANLNRKLASADLQIRGYYADHSEEDGDGPPKIHIALINLASDDVAKLTGASQKEEEITCLKSILKALASNDGAELAELTAVRETSGALAKVISALVAHVDRLSGEVARMDESYGKQFKEVEAQLDVLQHNIQGFDEGDEVSVAVVSEDSRQVAVWSVNGRERTREGVPAGCDRLAVGGAGDSDAFRILSEEELRRDAVLRAWIAKVRSAPDMLTRE